MENMALRGPAAVGLNRSATACSRANGMQVPAPESMRPTRRGRSGDGAFYTTYILDYQLRFQARPGSSSL